MDNKHIEHPECYSESHGYALLAAYCKERGRWAEIRLIEGAVQTLIYKPTDDGKIEIASCVSSNGNISIANALYNAMVYDTSNE